MRTSSRILACVLLICLLLVGCVSAGYPLFHHDPQRTGFVPEAGPGDSTLRWSAPIGEFIGAPPIVDGGRVYVGVWPDMNFQPGEEYYFYCLDVASGDVVWKNPLGVGMGTVSGAAISGDRLFVGCMDGRLYCIDRQDGTTLWSAGVDLGQAEGNWYGLASCPVVDNGMVYVTSLTDGALHAFTTDGTETWNVTTGNGTFAYSSPAVDGDRVFFAGNAGVNALYCVDTATHREIWNTTVPGEIKSTPVISGGTVFVTTTNTLIAVNTENGSVRWTRPISASWGTPAVAGTSLYLGTKSDFALHCFDTVTGDERWTFTANGKIDTSPVVTDNAVYFSSNCATGTVYAVDTSGHELWRHATTNYVMSSPSVSDGTLYIGSDEGTLYAFGSTPAPTPVRWNGTVPLADGTTFSIHPVNDPSATLTVNRTSALGALDAAATAGTFNYTVKSSDWGPFIDSIGGVAYNATSWDSWLYMVNGVPAAVGAADYALSDGDVVTFWYGAWGSTPESARDRITITVSIGALTPVPRGSGSPTDLNKDGRYEDVNGNGRSDFADVVLYFNQISWIVANEPISAFDYNGNGRIDFADVVALFNTL